MLISPYQVGLRFRSELLEGSTAPPNHGALIRDLAVELEELQPALLDLVSRRGFQQLPLRGSAAEQVLARDALLSQMSWLYRDSILQHLLDFLEGVLGFVEDVSERDSPSDDEHSAAALDHDREDFVPRLSSSMVEPPQGMASANPRSMGFSTTPRLWIDGPHPTIPPAKPLGIRGLMALAVMSLASLGLGWLAYRLLIPPEAPQPFLDAEIRHSADQPGNPFRSSP